MTTREEEYNKLFIRLSGHFLAVHLEDDFFDLDDDEQIKQIEDHAWEPLEYHDGIYVYSLIENLTDEVMSIMKR